ncbi:cytochrome c [Candidatus Entotheonella palauensis]|uniref:Cytochrome c domain-containing protein n=1 Tax=Candidatus Entotheonella gemina TaxID=1429439 RepID=W4M2U9_9BACT|nr:cytochrome c [Candidatus Entotheonella palauensis]ETX03962.1 MAG: hypothetical protein ETSY2_31535 [Candidatus Entotheonella gemina]
MKKVNRVLIIGLAITGLYASLWIAWAEDKSESVHREKTFMRAKLIHTQQVLEGLLTEDFDEIVKHSQKMSLLTRALAWQMLEAAEYSQRSAEFRRSVDQLTEAAKKKNLDGVSLAYIDITIKCVECHKYVRKMRHTHLDRLKIFDSGHDSRLARADVRQ